jgi:hypothetical protein
MISMGRSYAALAMACLLSGCSAGSVEQDPTESVEQTSSGLVQSETATLTVTQDWGTGFCANVNVKNTNLHSSTTQSWTVKFSMYSATFTSGWEGTFSQSGATLTISNSANNKNIASGATASPTPGFCANRPAGTPLPTFLSGTGNYCGTAYPDADGDGQGVMDTTRGIYTCDQPAGYASNSNDCCDSDARVHTGVTPYYSTPNNCGNFSYSCGGISKEKYGPTGCFEAPMTCTISADQTRCIASAPPAQCNGSFTSYTPGECGQDWYYSTKGCSRVCTSRGCFCTTFSSGGPGGTQRCH